VNQLESALQLLRDDGTGLSARPDLADRALNRARQRNRRRGTLAVVSTAAVAALITVGVTTTAAQQIAHRISPPASSAHKTGLTSTTSGFAKARMNVLLIGSDAAPGAGLRPDTLILASIDTTTGATTMFSFPSGLDHAPSGLTATKQAIEQSSGLEVDDTAVLTPAGIQGLVDAGGGVELIVRERLPTGGDGWIEKGRQHLNGFQAEWFARSRWNGDDDRMVRQQCLITALVQQVDIRKLIAAHPTISTSITLAELPHWAELLSKIRGTKIQMLQVGEGNIRHQVQAAIDGNTGSGIGASSAGAC
jgi:anionic cell wall polymer biosynthesis LytR-Cps2A-Psr (LCP) family protein